MTSNNPGTAESYALEMYFHKYLEEKTTLKSSSIKHYMDALKWISGHFRAKGVINNCIYEESSVERLYELRNMLFSDEEFKALNNRGNSMYSAGMNHYICFAEATDFETNAVRIDTIDIPVSVGGYTIDQGSKRWKRSALIKDQSMYSAGFQCEVEGQHKTFISARTGRQYMEGHHLIAMQRQDSFRYSLDIYANIVCLCPLCHRRLHFATEEEKLPSLYQLYEARKDRLANSGIKLSRREFIDVTK